MNSNLFQATFAPLNSLSRPLKRMMVTVAILILSGMAGWAQVSITALNTAFTQNFDGMGSSATATLPTGFKIGADWSSGTTATTLAYGTTGTGAVTGTSGGGVINWANGVTASATDRSLGFLNTGSFTSPQSIVYAFVNNSGSTITSLTITFDYEKSRSGIRQFDWTFFHGSSSSPATSATSGDQSFAADANNTVISNPPLTTSKTVTITGLSIAPGATYYLKWTFTGLAGSTNGKGMSIDNFSITAASTATPTITGAATASAFTTTYGTASAAQTFSVSGANLTANLVATAPTGFEVSSDGTTYGTTATFTQTSGSASGTLSIRLKATAAVSGSYNAQNIVLSSTGATSVNITTAASGNSVSAKALTITADARSKTYGSTLSLGASAFTSSGLENSETIGSVTLTASGGTAATDAATTYTITPSAATGGTFAAGNYSIAYVAGVLTVNPKALTVTANNVTKPFGDTLTGGAGSTAFTSSGLANSETIGSVTITYGTGAASGATAGSYAGQVTPSAATGGTFTPANYTISYVSGDITVTADPTISTSGTLAAVDTTYGTASPTPTTFSVSGVFLTGDLTVTPPSGFEVSLSSGSGYTTSLTVPASGTLASTLIYVRLAATTAFGTYSGNIVISGGGATSQNVAIASSSVAKKALTITGLTGDNKIYDRTTTASVSGTPAYVGLENGETFSVSGTPSATFATVSVGAAKPITVTGYTAPSANYTLSQPAGLTGDITPLALTVTGATVTSKVYNSSTAATIMGASLVGVISPDVVTIATSTGTYADANVGIGIAVTAALTLGGADAANYSITQPTGLTGDITIASQTITFAALADKTIGDAPFALTATASSGLAVSYASSTPTVATVSGSTVTIVGAGTTTITASQAGTANYSAATDVARTLTVVAPSPHLVLVRIGDGTQTLTANGNTVFLDQYSASGSLVQSVTIPDSGSTPLILTPVTTSDGALSRSPDGKLLGLAGYKVARLSSSSQPSTASSATVPRAGVTVDGAGNIVMPVQTTLFSGTSIRSVATDANGNYWASGGNSGTAYLGTGTPAVIQSATANTRVNAIVNGNLYYSTGAGTVGIYQFSGTPTTATAPTLLFGITSGSPYGFSINPSGTVAYVADDRASSAGGILRYNFVSGSWSLAYTLGTGAADIGARGLAVDWSGANPVIYATTAEGSANRLIKITDTGSGSVASTLATAGASKIFRGLAFAPVPVVTTPPASTSVCVGFPATFTAAGAGTPSPTAQWQISADGGTTWSDIPSATSVTTYSFTPELADSGKLYRVVYTNVNGTNASPAATLTVNALPLAPSTISSNITPTLSLKISIASVLSSWSGSGLSLQGVTSPSASNGTVFADSTYIYYLPPAGAIPSDFFTYTVTNASGCATLATFNLVVAAPPGVQQISLTIDNNTPTVRFFGVPGVEYDIQRAPETTGPWTIINATPLTPAGDGSVSYTDTSAPNGQAFYRTIQH